MLSGGGGDRVRNDIYIASLRRRVVLCLMPREGGGLPTAEQKREDAKRPTAEQKREDAKRRGLALSFVSLLVLDVGLLGIVLELYDSR